MKPTKASTTSSTAFLVQSGTAKFEIAHVGANKPMTYDDCMRAAIASELARDHGVSMRHSPDVINLADGRDFLAESKPYDIVVLHSIFHTHVVDPRVHIDDRPAVAAVSPLHTEDAWRKRLASSQARVIVVWELLPGTLSGWQLDEIPGYRIAKRDHKVTVYLRKKGVR
jgi:hypothetical protein